MNVRVSVEVVARMQHQTITADGDERTQRVSHALNKYRASGFGTIAWATRGSPMKWSPLKAYPVVANRWKTAPVMTEYCYQSPGSGGFERASGRSRSSTSATSETGTWRRCGRSASVSSDGGN
jgi:hypothetical protein